MFGPPRYQPTNTNFGLFQSAPRSFPSGPVQSPPQALAGGRGLLSQLFGGSASSSIGSAVGASSMQGLNIGQMLGYAQHAQQVIKTVQTVGPIIQQYGPMLKSLPAFLQLLKSSDSASEVPPPATDSVNELEDIEESEESSKPVTIKKKVKKTPPPVNKKRKTSSAKIKKSTPSTGGLPKPKLYI